MSFSRSLSTLLVSWLCFTIISSGADPDPVLVEDINFQLQNPHYTPIFQVALVAASVGKHLFEMPKSLSEDCVRTAIVAFKLADQPSLFDKSKSLIPNSMKAVQDLKKPRGSDYAIELLCHSLNDQFKKMEADFPNVEELKKNVNVPRPAQNYFIKSQPFVSIDQMMVGSMNELKDPAFVKEITAEALLNADTKLSRVGVETAAISKTIRELAKREAFRSTVDSAFEQLLDAYVKELYSKPTDMPTKFDNDCYPYLKKMDEYFLQNSVLKEEYAKLKKEIMVTMSQPKQR